MESPNHNRQFQWEQSMISFPWHMPQDSPVLLRNLFRKCKCYFSKNFKVLTVRPASTFLQSILLEASCIQRILHFSMYSLLSELSVKMTIRVAASLHQLIAKWGISPLHRTLLCNAQLHHHRCTVWGRGTARFHCRSPKGCEMCMLGQCISLHGSSMFFSHNASQGMPWTLGILRRPS